MPSKRSCLASAATSTVSARKNVFSHRATPIIVGIIRDSRRNFGTFIKQINANVNHYLAHEHHTFTNKMKTLINLNVSELAHIAIEKHASPKSKTMHNSLKKYYNSIKLVQDMEQKDEL